MALRGTRSYDPDSSSGDTIMSTIKSTRTHIFREELTEGESWLARV